MGSGNSKDFDTNALLRGGGHRMFANLGPCINNSNFFIH